MATRMTKEDAIAKFGADVVNKAMHTMAEPTNRLMYPAFEPVSHLGKHEWAGDVIAVGDETIQAYYYLTPEDEQDTDGFDWEGNAEFDVE